MIGDIGSTNIESMQWECVINQWFRLRLMDENRLKKFSNGHIQKGVIDTKYGCMRVKAAYSVTMNIFRKKKYFLFKSFVKVELSYVFTIKMFSTAENCTEK